MASTQPVPLDRPSSTASLTHAADAAMEANLMLQRVTLLYEGMPAALAAGLGCALRWSSSIGRSSAELAAGVADLPYDPLHRAIPPRTIIQSHQTDHLYEPTLAPRISDRNDSRRTGMGCVGADPVSRVFSHASGVSGVRTRRGLRRRLIHSAARFDAFLSFALPTLMPLIRTVFFLNHEHALCPWRSARPLVFPAHDLPASRTSNTVLETLRLKYHNAQLVDQLASTTGGGTNRAASERPFRTLSLHHGVCADIIYRTDRSGRFSTFINPAVIRLLGYHETEMLGHRALDLVHPSYRRTTEHFYIRQFLRKLPSTYYEFPVVTRRLQTLWVGQNVQLLLRDQEVIGFQAVMRDISARKQTEEALRFSQERYRALYESSPEMLLTVDSKGNLLTVNATAAAELGYDADALIGQPVSLIVHANDQAKMQQHF